MPKPSEFEVTYALTGELKLRVSSSDGDGARAEGDEALSETVIRGTLETGEAFELVLLSGKRVACSEVSE